MAGEGADTEIQYTSGDLSNQTRFERVALKGGRYAESFFERYPSLRKLRDVTPEIYVANPGKPEALITVAGFQVKHTGEFLKGHGIELAKESPDTVITVAWPKLSDIVELRWRSIADYLESTGTNGVKFFGTSYGGRESLVALKHLRKLTEEGFKVSVKDIVVVVAPVNKGSIQAISRMGIPNWLLLQAAQKVEPFITPFSTLFPETRADVVRVRELLKGEQFKPGDFQDGQIVHYFGTDPEDKLDPLVNQPVAIKQLKELGINVVEHWYKPDLENAHYPHEGEMSKLLYDAKSILGQ